jgi:hypothetical protein
MMGSELLHIVAHSILYGSLGVALAVTWFPSHALEGARSSLRRRALFAAGSFCFVAGPTMGSKRPASQCHFNFV